MNEVEKKLKDQIFQLVWNPPLSCRNIDTGALNYHLLTDQILAIKGIAILADDQTLPEHHLSSDLSDTGLARAIAEDELLTIQETQQEMLQAGFKKTIKMEGN